MLTMYAKLLQIHKLWLLHNMPIIADSHITHPPRVTQPWPFTGVTPGSAPCNLHLAPKFQAPLGAAISAALSCAGTHRGATVDGGDTTFFYMVFRQQEWGYVTDMLTNLNRNEHGDNRIYRNQWWLVTTGWEIPELDGGLNEKTV